MSIQSKTSPTLLRRDLKIKTNLQFKQPCTACLHQQCNYNRECLQWLHRPGLRHCRATESLCCNQAQRRVSREGRKKRRLAVRSCNWRSKDGAGSLGGEWGGEEETEGHKEEPRGWCHGTDGLWELWLATVTVGLACREQRRLTSTH